MTKFLNIIPSEGDTACLLLYGDIGWECDPREVVMEIMALEAKYDRIDVRINSYGGDVASGLAIFNALKASSADIHIYVDGVAASMAAVIALCGKPLQMSKYSHLMLHAVSSGVWGNKNDMEAMIDKLKSLELTLAKIIAPRLKITEEEVISTYFDDKDHWMSSEQALQLGFVDAIFNVDGDDKVFTNLATPSKHTIYTFRNHKLRHQPTNNKQQQIEQPTNEPTMNNFFDTLRGQDRFKAFATEEALLGEINRMANLASEAEKLKEENDALKADAEKRRDEEITNLLDQAEQDGRLPKSERRTFENLLKADLESGRKALAMLKPKKSVTDFIDDGSEPQNRGAWERRMEEIAGRTK